MVRRLSALAPPRVVAAVLRAMERMACSPEVWQACGVRFLRQQWWELGGALLRVQAVGNVRCWVPQPAVLPGCWATPCGIL
eukprot:11047297-Lingulodinium_polyedra.AAC.1